MPSLSTICNYALYIIGSVETGCTWTYVDFSSTISIGIINWKENQAAELLNRLGSEYPSLYNTLTGSLRHDLSTYSESSRFWQSRQLSQEEGNSIINVFQNSGAQSLQTEMATENFEECIEVLEGWGFNTSHPKPLIFAMAIYNQSPQYCAQIISSAGGNATLNKLYTTLLNHRELNRFATKYTSVYNMLNSWDGESNPPDYGTVTGNIVGGNPSGVTIIPTNINYIIQVGNNLIVYGDNQYKDGVTFYKTAAQTWKCGYNADGTLIYGGNWGGGNYVGTEAQRRVAELYKSWVGRFYYSQGAGRLDPLHTGYGDCSSTIWAAYHEITQTNCGTHTGEMIMLGKRIASGHYGSINENILQLGDLLIINWRNDGSYPNQSSHVEMYVGNGQLCGHGGNPVYGPTLKNLQDYIASCPVWQIRRYLNV